MASLRHGAGDGGNGTEEKGYARTWRKSRFLALCGPASSRTRWRAISDALSRLPTTRTRKPCWRSCSTVWLPMYPAPPVTTTSTPAAIEDEGLHPHQRAAAGPPDLAVLARGLPVPGARAVATVQIRRSDATPHPAHVSPRSSDGARRSSAGTRRSIASVAQKLVVGDKN